MRALALLAVLLPSTLGALPAAAQPMLKDLSSVRAEGMGGAARGFASGVEALALNPAGIAATTRFNVSGEMQLDQPNGLRSFGLSAVDSKLNADEVFALAGGAAYSYYRSGKGEFERRGSVVALALSLPVAESLFVGVTGRYLSLDGRVRSRAGTMDAGLLWRPIPWVGLGAAGYNLIDVRCDEARRAWGFGAAVGSDLDYRLAFDVRLDLNAQGELAPSYLVGGEYLIAGTVVPRAGFVEDRANAARYLSGGATVLFSTVAVDAMYQHSLTGEGRRFGLSFRLLQSPL